MNLTTNQLVKACEENRFLLLRDNVGVYGFNAAVAKLKRVAERRKADLETNYVSYRPCTFMEYLNYKIPFINR